MPRIAAARGPMIKRIFDEFPDLLHIFHNDTPNMKVYPNLARVGVDVFNFSDEIDARVARDALGPDMVLMGNIPPLDVLSRGTPEQVRVRISGTNWQSVLQIECLRRVPLLRRSSAGCYFPTKTLLL